MYPLGKQFEVDYSRAASDKKVVVQGENYRFSVITERVVRLEFSPSGNFNDRPTQLIKNRSVGLQPNIQRFVNRKYFIRLGRSLLQ